MAGDADGRRRGRPAATAALTALVLALAPASVGAQGVGAGGEDASREAAALAFVGEHHPELAALLARLKTMRPDEYDRAIRQLWPVARSLGNLKARDPRRYELALDLWKARSRVDLLTARLAASGRGAAPEIESQLREAVAAQLSAEIRQQRHERDQVEARLRRLTEGLRKLEADPDAVAEGRYQALLKKSQRARREAAAAPKAADRPRPGADSKPNANANRNPNPNPNPTPTRGDRP